MSKILRPIVSVIAILAPFASVVLAQPVSGPPPCWPPPCIPIDGGISALLIAGLAYGGGKALQQRRAKAAR